MSSIDFTTWMRSLRNDLQSNSLRLLGDKKQDWFHVDTGGNNSETSSAAAELHKHEDHRVKRQMSMPG